MKTTANWWVAAFVLSLTGCSSMGTAWQQQERPFFGGGGGPGAYTRADSDELLRFGSDLAKKSAAARADECRLLLKRQQDTAGPGMGIQLHLMVGRTLSNACGDSARIVESLSAIPRQSLPDERVQWLVDVDTEVLKRLASASASKKPAATEGKAKTAPAAPESPSDELRICKEKLEAIRSMEKSLDESR